MPITFARTRHHYGSYTDFWRLVECSGFSTCYVDEIDLADDRQTYIFTPINGETMPLLPAWKDRRCKIVWWNLERPEDETLPASLASVKGAVDAVWVSDRSYAALHGALTYVALAGHHKFGACTRERSYDVCHLSYVHGRRGNVIADLSARGLKIAPDAYGKDAQDRVVSRSHLMLNLHQYDGMFILAPIRFAVAASYAIPIVSETCTHPDVGVLAVATAPLAKIVKTTIRALSDKDRLREHGAALYERMCVTTDFGREVENAVHLL